MPGKENIISAGKYIFLAGIALLIVRNNSYPFYIKRASDILFFASAAIAIYAAWRFKTGYENFAKNKNAVAGIILVCLGLAVATLSGYFLDGRAFSSEGLLNIGRFAEVFLMVFLVSFFQSFDGDFYKKAALAQLSTLAYLPALFFPRSAFIIAMYRFNLFENWPSNVGYYLIPSLLLMAVFLFKEIRFDKKLAVLYFVAASGLSAIMLWTQSRASWVGLLVSFSMFLIILKMGYKRAGVAALTGAVILTLGFFILLPQYQIENMIIKRIMPQTPGSALQQISVVNSSSGLFTDPSRINLWKIYSEMIAGRPLGFGVNYEPINIGSGPQGPHNTVLEFLVLAGPLGLAGLILLIFAAFKNTLVKIKKAVFENRLWFAYIASSLAGLLVASMFDNMSMFRLSWLILGMALFA